MSSENDVTADRTAGETRSTRGARASFDPPAGLATQMAEAMALATERQRNAHLAPAPLGETVRAHVRCGMRSDGVTPLTMHFTSEQTADGLSCEVEHGRPVRLKRAAFELLSRSGQVIRAE